MAPFSVIIIIFDVITCNLLIGAQATSSHTFTHLGGDDFQVITQLTMLPVHNYDKYVNHRLDIPVC